MKFPISFRGIRKSFLILFVLALVGGYSVHDAVSHYTGDQVPGTAKLGNCGGPSCHGPLPSRSTVIHLFTPDKIIAGKTYTFRISVSNSDPADVAAGFDVDVDTPVVLDTIRGMNTFSTAPFPDFSTEWSITHSIPQLFSVNGNGSDSAVWSFLYTAPKVPGSYPIYLAGNAVNGDSVNADTEDHWNVSTMNITVVANDGVTPDASQQSIQIYPNPASNELFISDGNLADVGSYTLSDAAGRVVKYGSQITLDGKHSVDLSKIAAGAYIVSVQPRMGQAFSRRIVIQR